MRYMENKSDSNAFVRFKTPAGHNPANGKPVERKFTMHGL